ncbi:MAG: hypothetical protein FIB03_19425 [Anaerolineae bacterium]|nr:hypothetical protein [Anaerolineae bacterium]
MSAFISWYILIILLGWLTFPLAFRLFPALADRGYVLARALGLFLWGYIFWLFASLGMAQNNLGGLLLGLVVLGGLSIWAFVNRKSEIPFGHDIVNWVGENRRLILTTELLFLAAFGFMTLVRAANPDIVGTEKPMELMMIQGVMNSPIFPSRDLWLSGYAISYYHFGYVMTAMLATFTGVPATMAFNLMIALVFGLGAVGAYGILYNLLSHHQSQTTSDESKVTDRSAVRSSLLAPLFLLLVSNAEGFLEVLHRRGIFWQFNADGTTISTFWKWLDILELRDAPLQPLAWIPDRYLWWWRASRVIMDYDLQNVWKGDVINEFPAFSFILSDLHPHVLAIPFMLLAISFALNLFLGGWRGRIDLYLGQLHVSKTGFFLMALMLGGLAFLNTWDILPGAALIVFSYALVRVREAGWGRERIEDVVLLGVPLVLAAYVLYLPFFAGFSSQAGGIIPSLMFPTRGAQLWVMWGTLFIPIFAYLIHSIFSKTPAAWGKGIGAALGVVLLLVALRGGIGFLAHKLRPEIVQPLLQSQGRDGSTFLVDSMIRRLKYIGGLFTLLALLIPSLSFLFAGRKTSTEDRPLPRSSAFILLLIVLGVLLILGPDFLYLQDNFGYRINTIFKFYYQAWILLSIASAYGTAVLLRRLRGAARGIFSVIFAIILVVGLTYPVLGFLTRTNRFNPPFGFSLDDFVRVQRDTPDEAAAMLWLRSAPDGVIMEATGDPYSVYGRMSIYSGHPTVLGWGNHEGQWRDATFQGMLNERRQDVETFYSTPNWDIAQAIIDRYNVRYVVVGNLERASYGVREEKFNTFLKPVFQQGNVTIYEVP